MVERAIKSTGAGWGLLALGAALSTAWAALLLLRRERPSSGAVLDPSERWWRGTHHPQLFV
jgi:hypothetical protein